MYSTLEAVVTQLGFRMHGILPIHGGSSCNVHANAMRGPWLRPCCRSTDVTSTNPVRSDSRFLRCLPSTDRILPTHSSFYVHANAMRARHTWFLFFLHGPMRSVCLTFQQRLIDFQFAEKLASQHMPTAQMMLHLAKWVFLRWFRIG